MERRRVAFHTGAVTVMWILLLAGSIVAAAPGVPASDEPAVAEPSDEPTVAEAFKLGTFEADGREFVGMVLRDRWIVDLVAANRDFEKHAQAAAIPMPKDMSELVGRYEYGMKRRLYELANWLVSTGKVGDTGAAHVRDADDLRILAPLRYPDKILNAAGNYYGHVGEALPPEEQARIAAERRRNRGVPYLFQKPTVGVVIGDGDKIVIPHGRDRIDWECELAVVIGRPAKYVPAAGADDVIFGYTILLDISDRGGRPEEEPRQDWLVGKGHDTFAPMGPWIVPKEFIGDPMDLAQRLTVNGEVMQDARSSDMIFDVYELVEYASWILTLHPGDVIAAGSPAGAGISRTVRPEPVFLKPGDRVVASIEGIGTLTHQVSLDEAPSGASQWWR